MRVKICGITKQQQAKQIAQLGATALGFICVRQSPRYISPDKIGSIVAYLSLKIDLIGVFADADFRDIVSVVTESNLTGIQLHGNESPQFCQQLRELLPTGIELIKALRIKTPESLVKANAYSHCVDTLLLDAYHPQRLGGTGKTLNWEELANWQPSLPWLLAGGLTANNILEALTQLHPQGIDLSSGVERSPGDKDIKKVAHLFEQLKQI
jgi:phosphoribosylanthranilate isomerase